MTVGSVQRTKVAVFVYIPTAVFIKIVFLMTGPAKPGWAKTNMKPVWWPCQVPFPDINNIKPRPKHEDLVTIMSHYREWRDLEGQGDDEEIYEGSVSPLIPAVVVSNSTISPLVETSSSPATCQAHVTELVS